MHVLSARRRKGSGTCGVGTKRRDEVKRQHTFLFPMFSGVGIMRVVFCDMCQDETNFFNSSTAEGGFGRPYIASILVLSTDTGWLYIQFRWIFQCLDSQGHNEQGSLFQSGSPLHTARPRPRVNDVGVSDHVGNARSEIPVQFHGFDLTALVARGWMLCGLQLEVIGSATRCPG